MTVNNLWSILDTASQKQMIGINDLRSRTLAIDLSIWLCEGLTSTLLRRYHASPSSYLVFSRTIALLKIGVTPVFCMEGMKRRLIESPDDGELGKISTSDRRPPEFTKACKECEQILRLLGCPIMYATYEAEALCAKLNSEGVVYGGKLWLVLQIAVTSFVRSKITYTQPLVITNDADSFLYGAKRIYRNFSIENLKLQKITLYDTRNLCAKVKIADSSEGEATNILVPLSRDDLVAFSLFAGSDLSGKGVPHVGGSKVARFIRECKQLGKNPLETVQKEWKRDALILVKNQSSRLCRRCLHPGDCRSHERDGCTLCGTSSNSSCVLVSQGMRFILKLKEKALAVPTFASEVVIQNYLYPEPSFNDKCLKKFTAKVPSLKSLLFTEIQIHGKTKESSAANVLQLVSKQIVRQNLIVSQGPAINDTNETLSLKNDFVITPIKIEKRVIHKGYPSYEIKWLVKDLGYEFLSFEWESLVQCKYPKLVNSFNERERSMFQKTNHHNRENMFVPAKQSGKSKRRSALRQFDKNIDSNTDKRSSARVKKTKKYCRRNESSMLLRHVQKGSLDARNVSHKTCNVPTFIVFEATENNDGSEVKSSPISCNSVEDCYQEDARAIENYSTPVKIIQDNEPEIRYPCLSEEGVNMSVAFGGISVTLSPITIRLSRA